MNQSLLLLLHPPTTTYICDEMEMFQLAAVRSRYSSSTVHGKFNDINFNNKESLDDDDDVNNIDLIENEN